MLRMFLFGCGVWQFVGVDSFVRTFQTQRKIMWSGINQTHCQENDHVVSPLVSFLLNPLNGRVFLNFVTQGGLCFSGTIEGN